MITITNYTNPSPSESEQRTKNREQNAVFCSLFFALCSRSDLLGGRDRLRFAQLARGIASKTRAVRLRTMRRTSSPDFGETSMPIVTPIRKAHSAVLNS